EGPREEVTKAKKSVVQGTDPSTNESLTPGNRGLSPTPPVGFVSLGRPQALVDSENILTQLQAEGYEIAPSYEGSDLVVVNTCGFIDAAVQESLGGICEELQAEGEVYR